MDRTEKLTLSADTEYCHCFRQGMFARLYEQGLHWFSHAVKPLKPMQAMNAIADWQENIRAEFPPS